jgi:Concanavalin A-like lectin/glucanases superfamily/Immunoglobulin I-set domain/PQQ-like domain
MKSGQKWNALLTALFAGILLSVAGLTAWAQSDDVLTWHNDNARTGQNLNEPYLTPANVNSNTFGLLWVLPVDGKVDGQPLYAGGVSIPNQGLHNVLFVVTEHDSVYAFDADSSNVLWHVSMLGTNETPSDIRNCSQIKPEIGITATPVIDRQVGSNGTLFVVAMSKQGFTNYFHRLHALDLATGIDRVPPATIVGVYPGTGDNSSTNSSGVTNVVFDPSQYKERTGLLLLNGVVYTMWTSHCDKQPYTGWVMGYDEQSLAQTNLWNVTPNGTQGAIWMSGAGPAADTNGNIYFLDGNGTLDTTLSTNGFPTNSNFGNSFIKLSTFGNVLSPVDYFAPSNTIAQNAVDLDFGSGGVLVLPDMMDTNGQTRRLAVAAGKDQDIYLLDRSNLGQFNPGTNAIYQQVFGALGGGVWGTPAYFNGVLYYGPTNGPVNAFPFQNARLTHASSQTAISFAYPGTTPSISANGNSNGIIWAYQNVNPAVLHAYAATNLAVELYNSNQAVNNRDNFGGGNKFIVPTIANGRVYVGTTNGVGVFGLFDFPPVIAVQPTNAAVLAGANASFSVNASGTPPYGYQWQFNGANLSDGGQFSGTGTATLSISGVQGANMGGYAVVVTNSAGSVTSAVASLTVVIPPAITAQPPNQSVLTGSNLTFAVSLSGTAPFGFQWQFNGVNLTDGGQFSGSATATLSLTNVQLTNAGGYSVIVTNLAGSVTSSVAALTVTAPPSITTQPANQAVLTGAGVSFSVAVSGTPPFGYQWQFNGVNLSDGDQFNGSDDPTLYIVKAQPTNAGAYTVVVTNNVGSVTSAVATLLVTAPTNCLAPAAGIVGWWPGEGDASDIVGNNNGALQGGATASVVGVVGSAFGFDGTNSFVLIPDAPALRPANLTIEGWVRFDSLDSAGLGGSPPGQQYIVFKQNTQAGAFEGYNLLKNRYSNGDVFSFLISSAAGDSVEVDSVTLVSTGVWYHVAGVRGPNFVQLYINGQLEGQAAVNFAQDYATLPLYFGTSGQASWDHKFQGALDEVSLYNRALSSNEITAIYQGGAAGKCKSLARAATATAQITSVTATTVTLTFSAPPNVPYAVERATNIFGPWTTLGTTNTPAGGQFQWTDNFGDLASPPAAAYYRLQLQ